MGLTNAEIAARLGQLAALLKAEGANRYKVRAYRVAADALRAYPQKVSELLERGAPLPRIPGVGASIGAAIVEIAGSGTLASLARLEQRYHPGAAAIAEAVDISIRDAHRLARKLDVATLEELREKWRAPGAAEAIAPRLALKIGQGLSDARRLLWPRANELAENLRGALEAVEGVTRVEFAGSLRRGKDTVGTLQFVLLSRAPARVASALALHGGVNAIQEQSRSCIVCKLAAGPLLTVRFADEESWGTAMVEATGSTAHLEEVASAIKQAPPGEFSSEKAWYEARGLPWIAPELREGRGEVAAALRGQLPALIELSDLRGDLHAHTDASDGANTLEEMAHAARAMGYEYLGISDHSRSLRITNGLDDQRLWEQITAIDRLNARFKGFRLLKGSEVDILPDGSLDFADDVLKGLDLVIGSIHSRFGLDAEQQTQRLLRAIAHPRLTCLGHLTGRILLRRPGYEFDVQRVLRAVKRHGKWLEINASPDRLDIDDALAHRARQLGIPLLINTDAHSVRELDFMSYGVRQARRGWQSAATVMNTRPLNEFLVTLRETRSA